MGATVKQQTILLIEDDAQMAGYLTALLESEGYHVLAAGNGHDGQRLLAGHAVHLILTDLIMPECDGIELILTLRAQHFERPIIVMSGGQAPRGPDYLRMAKRLGATGTLAKPFTSEALLGVIREALSQTPNTAHQTC